MGAVDFSEKSSTDDVVSANGYIIKPVAVHKTVDSDGNLLAAVELEFTNNNNEPASFFDCAQVTIYQNNIEMTCDELFLENNYNWDSYDTSIKNGATISVFTAEPLKDDNSPVEVEISIFDYSTWTVVASSTFVMDLVD